MLKYYAQDWDDEEKTYLVATFTDGVFNWSLDKQITLSNNIFQDMFLGAKNIKKMIFNNIITIQYDSFAYCCKNCTNLHYVEFPDLTSLTGENNFNSAFIGCNNLDVFFPKLTSIEDTGSDVGEGQWAFINACDDNANVKFHLPSSMQSTSMMDIGISLNHFVYDL